MGHEYVVGKFSASLSRHNSPKDYRHDELWLDFIKKIKEISTNPKYTEILLNVEGHDLEEEV
jgi:hypothetical protein